MAVRLRAKVGRPTSYNDKVAAEICSLIAEGNSLRSICKRNKMPDKATVIRWLGVHREFSDQYARAREAQADKLFEESLEIADDTSGDYITTTAQLSGRSITSTSNAQSSASTHANGWPASSRPRNTGKRWHRRSSVPGANRY
jgi:hypothetical protein